ncbi:DNA-dependent ATPase protein rad54 [Dinochytrium kinnereticum]|nr:DNA-dependent ATPase protein rad54 [Dinochytrium kinnereticum]
MKRPKPKLIETDDENDENEICSPVKKAKVLTPSIGLRRPLSSLQPSLISPLAAKPFRVPTFSASLESKKVGGFKNGSQLGVRRQPLLVKGPVHDPNVLGAIILYVPETLSDIDLFEASKSTKLGQPQLKQKVHVVIDPILGKILRPHQVEGVRFLYECVTGNKAEDAFGCIMADEMGLGKTLQCITLLWTLLRQSPEPGKPTIEKAIIVCPSSLVKNWANELVKWLGADRIRPLSCDNKGSKEETTADLAQFVSAKGRAITNPVLIISYESLRLYSATISKTDIGLLLCDEGHRLKNSDSQTYQSLNALSAKRRVILSGTPIQNDLTEYYSLLSFVIPGVLGTEAEFRKNFENPILRGRDADALPKDRAVSEEKLQEMLVPVKYDYVVFCKLSPLQIELYKHFRESPELKRLLNGADSQPLKAITLLKKLCNHPALVYGLKEFKKTAFPDNFGHTTFWPQVSGKLHLLVEILDQVKLLGEKIVLISNYTQTLDMFDAMCRERRYAVLRLDGSLSIAKRQKLVDRFNDPTSPEFIFLLSSKAGGCGINLIGANRLVLFDPDWNPANDAQALARVWRDGQKKICYIYRFIATGSIEEKIFQRQAHKQSLSNCVVDEEVDAERHFSLDSLRKLFQLNEMTACDTHDAFNCKRCINGRQTFKPKEGAAGALGTDTSNWNHLSELEFSRLADTTLRECSKRTKAATFIFENKSHDAK